MKFAVSPPTTQKLSNLIHIPVACSDYMSGMRLMQLCNKPKVLIMAYRHGMFEVEQERTMPIYAVSST